MNWPVKGKLVGLLAVVLIALPSTSSEAEADAAFVVPFIGSSTPTSYHGYHALDFALPEGTALVASGDGTVKITRDETSCNPYDHGATDNNIQKGVDGCKKAFPEITGNKIVIKHADNSTSHYLHLSSFPSGLADGHTVVAGEVVGYAGNTGISTGSHLHYEERDANGIRVTPGKMVGCNSSGAVIEYSNVSASTGSISSSGTSCLASEDKEEDDDAQQALSDLNGDGYDDLIIGAPGVSSDAGAVTVLYGSRWGASAVATRSDQLWTQDSNDVDGPSAPGHRFGAGH